MTDQIYFEYYDDIQHLLAEGTLQKDSDAYSVARLTIDLGFGALSKRHRYIYDSVITPALAVLAREQGITPAANAPH
jgi:hypothetical protein